LSCLSLLSPRKISFTKVGIGIEGCGTLHSRLIPSNPFLAPQGAEIPTGGTSGRRIVMLGAGSIG
jgi:hypothetical protein